MGEVKASRPKPEGYVRRMYRERETPPKCRNCGHVGIVWNGEREGGKGAAKCPSCGYVKRICAAHPDTASGPCFSSPQKGGNGRCKKHADKKVGRHPIHGGRSKLHGNLGILDTIEIIRDDPESIGHRRNAELLEGLIHKTAEEAGQARERWKGAAAALAKFTKGDQSAINELRDILGEGLEASTRDEKITKYLDEQRKHLIAEDKRAVELGGMADKRDLRQLFAELIDIINRKIPDAKTRREIGLELVPILRRVAPSEPARN